ncbi:MAG: hypothetical protein WKG32_21700 [Gemmatimonadaceae bacterium]
MLDGVTTGFELEVGTADVAGWEREREPGRPLAQDLLVVVGEDANARTRGRRWNIRDNAERTFEWSMTELLQRIGKGDSGKDYASLRETPLRMARLRIEASGGMEAVDQTHGGERSDRPA